MRETDTLNRIRELGLPAIVRGPTASLTLDTVHALVRRGVERIEITFTIPTALEIANSLKDQYREDLLLGMGTLTSHEQGAAVK